MKILADASLNYVSELFATHFELGWYQHADEARAQIKHYDILLCRSTLKVDAKLLAGSAIQYVLTASSGIDHIDDAMLKKQGIGLLNAKACNARAVADYVSACLAYLLSSKNIRGEQAGIIGVGEVGRRVAQRLQSAGFQLLYYDPLKALRETSFKSCDLEQLYACDVLCLHANLHSGQAYPSKNLLNAAFFKSLNKDCCIINAARGGIVNENDLLQQKKHFFYCTDVYCNEPSPNAELLDYALLCTPHIAGHSIEAKNNSVLFLSQQLHQLLGLAQAANPFSASTIASHLNVKSSWQESLLSLYNPSEDTLCLKTAKDKTQAFLSQRASHQRHDFCVYDQPNLTPQTRSLLGAISD